MIVPRLTLNFDTRQIGRTVLVFDQLTSTNDVLVVGQHEPGTVIVADYQSAGRGQHGRVWIAQPKQSLLMSILLEPRAELQRPALLTAWAAVAMARTIKGLANVTARIKWPNDLLVDGKKICGILIEKTSHLAAGLGLNLNQSALDFERAGLPDATSIAMLRGLTIESETALATAIPHLDDAYIQLDGGDRTALETEWANGFDLLDRTVEATETDGRVTVGRLRELRFDGIELDTGSGYGGVVLQPESVRALKGI